MDEGVNEQINGKMRLRKMEPLLLEKKLFPMTGHRDRLQPDVSSALKCGSVSCRKIEIDFASTKLAKNFAYAINGEDLEVANSIAAAAFSFPILDMVHADMVKGRARV